MAEFEFSRELAVETEHELEIPCGLDPRQVCPTNCPLNNDNRERFMGMARTAVQAHSFSELVDMLRDPAHIDTLNYVRNAISRVLKETNKIELCLLYPEADINSKVKLEELEK